MKKMLNFLPEPFLDPISSGGGGGVGFHPSSGYSSITQKREKIFSLNLVTFVIDKWVIICTIRLGIDLSMLPW